MQKKLHFTGIINKYISHEQKMKRKYTSDEMGNVRTMVTMLQIFFVSFPQYQLRSILRVKVTYTECPHC